MRINSLTFLLFALASILFYSLDIHAQEVQSEAHVKVALRMVGHEVLLSLGDSSSRVLPIEKENDRYVIPFESEFEFKPDSYYTGEKIAIFGSIVVFFLLFIAVGFEVKNKLSIQENRLD